MARKSDRAIAMFFAVIFIVSSSALTVAVIWQMLQDNKKSDTLAESLKTCAVTKPKEATMDNKGALQGTPLTNFTPCTVDSLQKIDVKVGTGDEVQPGATVTVDYTGAVAATGIIFQSSLDSGNPISFPLSGVIPGWTEGVPGMKVGGTRRLLIPANLAYGATPPQGSGIPANADLVFDITLHKIGE